MHSSDHAENYRKTNCIFSHAQNTTALQPNVFLTGRVRFLVTNRERLASPEANHYQSQWQTPQPVTAHTSV
jgi:hypothetical protein